MDDVDDLRGVALWAGPTGIAVAFVGIVASAVLAPWFSWTDDALSDLGASGVATAPLFNGSLILAGVLGLVFAWRVSSTTEHTVQRVGVVVLAASFVALSLVGAFNLPEPQHGPVSVAFFVLFTYGLFLVGTGDVLAGRVDRGIRTIWLGIVHPTAWLVWLVLGIDGIAIPELVGSIILATWVVATARSIRRRAGRTSHRTGR